jgi:phosphorylcholine metabolism protein LicD
VTKFILIDGVLLGVVREKDFIKWDWDVELALYAEQMGEDFIKIREGLASQGFEVGSVVTDKGNMKINVHKYGTKYSLLGYEEKGKFRKRKNWRYPVKFFNNTEKILFRGNWYECPSPPEAYLEYQYGDWQTPKMETDQSKYLENRIRAKGRVGAQVKKFLRELFNVSS